MSIKVNFKSNETDNYTPIYFRDIEVNQAFKVHTEHGKGAVYIKVVDKSKFQHEYKMMEIFTGIVFAPTTSRIKLVDVEININEKKPLIYSNDVPF